MWKFLTAASTALVLVGTSALAQWEGWDGNADDFLDRNEFNTGWAEGGVFGDWDADEDAQLTQDEWRTGTFGQFDRDDDEMWNDEEFGAFSERNFGGWRDWDEDESGMLSQEEFDRGVFRSYDLDRDDRWDRDEFGAFEGDEWF